MYPRTNYEMTEADLEHLLNACKPVPYMVIGNSMPSGPQENANRAWAALGEKMGFDWLTVEPRSGLNARYFSAVPSETETQRQERIDRDSIEAKKVNIERLEKEVEDAKQRLAAALA